MVWAYVCDEHKNKCYLCGKNLINYNHELRVCSYCYNNELKNLYKNHDCNFCKFKKPYNYNYGNNECILYICEKCYQNHIHQYGWNTNFCYKCKTNSQGNF